MHSFVIITSPSLGFSHCLTSVSHEPLVVDGLSKVLHASAVRARVVVPAAGHVQTSVRVEVVMASWVRHTEYTNVSVNDFDVFRVRFANSVRVRIP